MICSFDDLWQAHFEWAQGALLKRIKLLETSEIYFGCTPEEWFNFALPKVEKPAGLDLNEIKKVLSPISQPTAVYLHEKHVKAGFPQILTQNGYKLLSKDVWIVFNHAFRDSETEIPVEHIGLKKFPDYENLTDEVYKEEWGLDNRPFNEICRETLIGKRKSKVSGFSSEFFMIYEDDKPVAGAGLFLTKEVGYFHNDATYKQYRKKGYHTALIKERIKFCQDRGIETIYSIVEHKKQSFRNFERCGFKTWQVCELFTLQS